VLAGTQRESRPDSESDKDLFTVLNECKSTIPVVVICTKVDTLKDTYRGQEFAKLSFAELADKNLPAILEAKIAIRVENFEKKNRDSVQEDLTRISVHGWSSIHV
jgi:GTP-binding protein EngB required for normal cell division